MINPLKNFEWQKLHKFYDSMCSRTGRFDPKALALSIFSQKPISDRFLYYELVSRIQQERNAGKLMSFPTYQAIIYWKMSSTLGEYPNKLILAEAAKTQNRLQNLSQLAYFPHPSRIQQNKAQILGLVDQTLGLKIYYMKTGLAVCTTLLHFLYPDVIPIFDRMTLTAVEPWLKKKQAAVLVQDPDKFGQYAEHVWSLVQTYSGLINACGFRESPVRVVEMALWITRGNPSTPNLVGCGPKVPPSPVGTEQSESPESNSIEPMKADNSSELSPSGDEQEDDKGGLPIIIVLSDNAADKLIRANVKPQCGARKYHDDPVKYANTTWEIWVFKSELTELPKSKFPVTDQSTTGAKRVKDPGIGVRLTCSCHPKEQNQCEASFHRYDDDRFYIGSAKSRSDGGQELTDQYRAFLDTHRLRSLDANGKPKCVLLKFKTLNPTNPT